MTEHQTTSAHAGDVTVASFEVVTASILVIGDEILSGRTKDANIGFIAEYCTKVGIQVREVRVVPDVTQDIVDAVNALRARHTYVFTTGGIGPTHDDITADAIAAAFGVPIGLHPQAAQMLRAYFEARGVEVTDARMRMARIPEGAELIENSVSVAPGFKIGNVITMAGVPKIMQVMLDAVMPRLRTGARMHARSIDLRHPEGTVAGLFGQHQAEWPDVQMGSYPTLKDHRPMVQLVLRGLDEQRLDLATAALKAKLVAAGWLD
ncbi:MAG: competence/damage-inducible protein A [Hyphomicrobiaceae bacterium]